MGLISKVVKEIMQRELAGVGATSTSFPMLSGWLWLCDAGLDAAWAGRVLFGGQLLHHGSIIMS